MNLTNVVCTPHIGAQTKEAQELASRVIAEKVIQILRGVYMTYKGAKIRRSDICAATWLKHGIGCGRRIPMSSKSKAVAWRTEPTIHRIVRPSRLDRR